MKLLSGFLLTFSAFVALSGAKVIPNSENVSPRNASSIRCEYLQYTEFTYACFLTVDNPEGLDNFEAIEGDHLPGRTNNDVTLVYSIGSNTRVVPRIICDTFINANELLLPSSNIEFITEDSFAGCRGVVDLVLDSNLIETIPERAFAQNFNLHRVSFEYNRIRAITQGAFMGNHRINILYLGHNLLDTFNPAWFRPLAPTLTELYLYDNRFTFLPFFAFSELTSLEVLDIGINNFNSIPGNVFYGLMNLTTLFLDQTTTREIDPAWFMSLFNLQNLELHNNQIRNLPVNAFNNLVNLVEFSISNNNLVFINSNAFGASLGNLTTLYLMNNRIQAFDEGFLDRATSLMSIYLANNECSERNFFNVPSIREEVRSELQTCIRNFIGSISCNYVQVSVGTMCVMDINNVVGNEFDSVDGTHLAGQTDANVIEVGALFQNSRNVPSVICRQFVNVEEIYIEQSHVEIVNEAAFADCANLYYLNLEQNMIATIPDNTFRNNPALQRLDLGSNLISQLGNAAFEGTILKEIYLYDNLLTTFNPTPFERVGETLVELLLYGNRLTTLPQNAFSSLSALDYLDLDENPFTSISSEAFHGLGGLTHLSMERCNLRDLEPHWFSDLTSLTDLRLSNNGIRRLPPGIFNSLPNLWVLMLDNNNIMNLNSNAFGRSLESLILIYARSNGVNAIDAEIVNRARTLATLQLSGNRCVNQNFFNVQGNLDNVRTALAECSRMFTGFLSCEFVRVRNDYICHLSIQNPAPRDDFIYVPGNHMTGMFNNNVTVLDAMRQHSLNVPSVLCKQFPNLQDLYIDESGVEFINEDAFEYCTSLEWLDLYGNVLTAVPDFTFANSPNLDTIYFTMNQISHIAPSAFAGTRLRDLNLDQNQLTELDRRWMETIAGTLEILYVPHNRLRRIEQNTFENFNRLDWLSLGFNQINEIAPRAFDHLTALEYIWFNQNRLTEINPQWFENMRNLVHVSFYENLIEDVPAFAFSQLSRLRELDFGRNRIRMLHSDPFGSALSTLSYFMADFNNIEMIDDGFFDNMSNLQYLYLFGNKCANRNYFGVQNNRNGTRTDLLRCFDNFRREVPMTCVYMDFPGYDYTCYLSSNENIAGNDNTETIEGDHPEGRTNTDVLVVETYNQRIRTIPSVICRQFPNLQTLWMSYSGIQTFRESTFAGCQRMTELILEMNPVHILPAGLFTANAALSTLWLDMNRIYRIENGAFNGASISSLGLAVNHLTQVENGWFEGITETVQGLFLYANFIQSMPEDAFSRLTNLATLDIGLNPGFTPPANAFRGLTNLLEIFMDDNHLRSIHPEWFTDLANLVDLRIHRNQIREIPANAFAPLTSIARLVLGENQLRFFGVEAFGENPLTNLNFLSLISANLHAFSNELFDRAANLEQLYLYGNPCISFNFYSVQAEREIVREQLQQCRDNFAGSMQCQFIQITGYPYMCELMINNMVGHNHFTSVPGNHVGSNTHSDVLLLEAISQRTRNIPSILCDTFTNVDEIFMEGNDIEFLDETTFAGCVRLDKLTLAFSNIHSLPDNLLRSNANLGWFSVHNNQISHIGQNVFTGSRLDVIVMGENRLGSFNPAWFEGVNETLEVLDLSHNHIAELPENAFANLRFVLGVELSHNQGLRVPSTVFNTLPRLRDLHLDGLGLRSLDPAWIRSAPTIEMLTFSHNRIRLLQDGIFTNLPNLREIVLRNNSISYLSAYQFGFNTHNLTYLIADDNRINGVDLNLFDQSQNLNIFYMAGNLCFDRNIRNIRENREDARQLLWTCFENYGIDSPDEMVEV